MTEWSDGGFAPCILAYARGIAIVVDRRSVRRPLRRITTANSPTLGSDNLRAIEFYHGAVDSVPRARMREGEKKRLLRVRNARSCAAAPESGVC
jgi:hypothetical protein